MSQVTETLESPDAPQAHRIWGRLALLLLLAGILVLLSWVGLKAWRVYQASSSLLARQSEAEQLLAAGWRQADPDQLETLVLGTRSDLLSLERELGPMVPLLPLLSGLPRIGPLAESAPHLLEMADAGTEAAAYGLRGIKPALVELQNPDQDGPVLPILLQTVTSAQPDLARAAQALDRAVVAREQIVNSETLPWRVLTLLDLSDRWLPMGQDFLRFALVLPEVMGMNGPRRYLVLAQNQDELRPTGGFISGAGFLEVDNGRITRLDFTDAYFVDAWAEEGAGSGALAKPYADAPWPLQTFMMLDLFLFRDANFWPDFAVSAQKAMDLYAYGRDVEPLDGVIAVNQQSLKLLIEGLGPVTLPGSGERITGNNLVQSLQESWTLEDGVSERKAFLGPFAAAILTRVNEGMAEIDPIDLAQKVNQALEQKDMMIYMREPRTAAVLAGNDWDGRMPIPGDHDALMIVDFNAGYNKANYLVEHAADYRVTLSEAGRAAADLTVSHQHVGEPSDDPCWQGTAEEYKAGAAYLALTEKCYWNYLRIYAPAGSELVAGPRHLIPGETWFGGYDWQLESQTLEELPGFTTFDSWMLLPRGETIESRFQYTLPETVVQQEGETRVYGLEVLKQSGVRPYTVQVSVTLPPASTYISAEPQPLAVEDNTLFFTIELDSDRALSISYR
ncbi:MAG: DUF4012 domain-containing protein [Candidatus Promineifilaceae bacterium]